MTTADTLKLCSTCGEPLHIVDFEDHKNWMHQSEEQAKACRKMKLEATIGPLENIFKTYEVNLKGVATEVPGIGNHVYHTEVCYDKDCENIHNRIKDCVATFTRMLPIDPKYTPLPEVQWGTGALSLVHGPFRLTIQYDARGPLTGRYLYNLDGTPMMDDERQHAREYKSGWLITCDGLVEMPQ